ncbi:MAG: methyltransferase [Bacteroidetes bacterium]|nr:methyltransferase [Bacteroidota bacterium]
MAFRFKQFVVEDDHSTMRIGTDAILLGCWAEPEPARSILEIGTGCGVIALMLAQKSDARIDAIDRDEKSVQQAGANFRGSPWSDQLNPVHISLQDFSQTSDKKYDLIITNPPYFSGSLPSPDDRRNLARHAALLSPGELVSGVNKLLLPGGTFWVILPSAEGTCFETLAASSGLFLQKQMDVKPKPRKPVNRKLYCFSLQPCSMPVREELIIHYDDNAFTAEYIAFTRAYYFSLG